MRSSTLSRQVTVLYYCSFNSRFLQITSELFPYPIHSSKGCNTDVSTVGEQLLTHFVRTSALLYSLTISYRIALLFFK
jgi:hypothetical protein